MGKTTIQRFEIEMLNNKIKLRNRITNEYLLCSRERKRANWESSGWAVSLGDIDRSVP